MAIKTVFLALAVLLLASICIFVGVFYGVDRRRNEQVFLKAAVAADAGPCSEVGR